MENQVKLSYDDMRDNCTKLRDYAGQVDTIAGYVDTLVGSLSDVWVGQAKTTFEGDYDTLMKAMKETTSTMLEITEMVTNYINDMQEVEAAYGGSAHVSIG